jgi:hypothetical protein
MLMDAMVKWVLDGTVATAYRDTAMERKSMGILELSACLSLHKPLLECPLIIYNP